MKKDFSDQKAIILSRAAVIEQYEDGQTIQFKHYNNNNTDAWVDFEVTRHTFGPWDICNEGIQYLWRVKVQPDIRYVAIGVDPTYGDAYHTTGCYSVDNPDPFKTGKFISNGSSAIYNVVGKLRLEFDSSTNKLIKVEMIND